MPPKAKKKPEAPPFSWVAALFVLIVCVIACASVGAGLANIFNVGDSTSNSLYIARGTLTGVVLGFVLGAISARVVFIRTSPKSEDED